MDKNNFTFSSSSKKELTEKMVPTNPNKNNTSMNPFLENIADTQLGPNFVCEPLNSSINNFINQEQFFQSNLNNTNFFSNPFQDQSDKNFFKNTPFENDLNKTNFTDNLSLNQPNNTNFINDPYKSLSIENIAGQFFQKKIPTETNSSKPETLVKISQGDDETLPVVSVIVTIFSGASYDNLFRSVKQVAPEGRVSLYSANLNSIDQLLKVLKGEIIDDEDFQKTVDSLLKDIESVEPDCVLFNWECCSGCGMSFPQKEKTMELLKLLIDRKYMTMFSDFAMKSLIIDWDENLLGSNPFVRLGDCCSRLKLKFNPEVLKDCPSSQLKMVGQLCDKGVATLHALANTIVFGIDSSKVDPARFQLQVLTIVTENGGFFKTNDNSKHCEIGDEKGTVGHAIIKFNNGGTLLVSAGHWIELSNLDVNVLKLEKEAEKFGGGFSEIINTIKNSKASEVDKTLQFNKLASQFVQQCAPCNYSVRGLSKKDK